MEKRKSVKSHIYEKVKENPLIEQSWAKAPRGDPKITTKTSDEYSTWPDEDYEDRLLKKGYKTAIHNHPVPSVKKEFGRTNLAATPSDGDIEVFLKGGFKNMVIAQTNEDGEVEGYTLLRKPKHNNRLARGLKRIEEYGKEAMKDRPIEDIMSFKPIKGFEDMQSWNSKIITNVSTYHDDFCTYKNSREEAFEGKGKSQEVVENLDKFTHKYGIRCKFVPMPGYEFDRNIGSFVKKKSSSLEGKVAAVGFIFLGFALLLQLAQITGFAIYSGTSSLSKNILSGCLIFISLILLLYSKIKAYMKS